MIYNSTFLSCTMIFFFYLYGFSKFASGFCVKIPKRFVILYSNQNFSTQPLTFFEIIKPVGKSILTPSLVFFLKSWMPFNGHVVGLLSSADFCHSSLQKLQLLHLCWSHSTTIYYYDMLRPYYIM